MMVIMMMVVVLLVVVFDQRASPHHYRPSIFKNGTFLRWFFLDTRRNAFTSSGSNGASRNQHIIWY